MQHKRYRVISEHGKIKIMKKSSLGWRNLINYSNYAGSDIMYFNTLEDAILKIKELKEQDAIHSEGCKILYEE